MSFLQLRHLSDFQVKPAPSGTKPVLARLRLLRAGGGSLQGPVKADFAFVHLWSLRERSVPHVTDSAAEFIYNAILPACAAQPKTKQGTAKRS
jgi:hypothetical protein